MRCVFLLLSGRERMRFVGDAQERLRGARDAVEGDIVLALFGIDIFEPVRRQIERKVKDARDERALFASCFV